MCLRARLRRPPPAYLERMLLALFALRRWGPIPALWAVYLCFQACLVLRVLHLHWILCASQPQLTSWELTTAVLLHTVVQQLHGTGYRQKACVWRSTLKPQQLYA